MPINPVSQRSPSEQIETREETFLVKIGIFPPLAWGFVGVLLFMIGDGVAAGYLALYLQGRQVTAQNIALLLTRRIIKRGNYQ